MHPNMLLFSNTRNAGKKPLEHAKGWLSEFFKHTEQIVFFSYGEVGDEEKWEAYYQRMALVFETIGKVLISAHSSPDPIALVNKAKGFFMGGGNTPFLLYQLQQKGLFWPIRARILEGVPYAASSAGIIVIGRSITPTNDFHLVKLDDFSGMDLVPFDINPHHPREGEPWPENIGESRDKRIEGYHVLYDTPVVGLREGSALLVENGRIKLLGPHKIRYFAKKKTPVELTAEEFTELASSLEMPAPKSIIGATETNAHFFRPKTIINWQDLQKGLSIEQLLNRFIALDQNLIKQDDEGNLDESDACAKKFTNDNKGVPEKTRNYLDALAGAICENKVEVAEHCRLGLMDIFVLLANHVDQQNPNQQNPMPLEKDKIVLKFLKAAYRLSPVLDDKPFENYPVRYLSSHAQLLFYYGKALRHENAPNLRRLAIADKALKIAEHLSGPLIAPETRAKEDLHDYLNRMPTYALLKVHILRDLNRFEEAIQLISPQLHSSSSFHRILAAHHLAEIYFQRHVHKTKVPPEQKESSARPGAIGDMEKAFGYANAAVAMSRSFKVHLKYNALVLLMKLHHHEDQHKEAQAIAEKILRDYAQDRACGARPAHLTAAEELLAENHPSLAFSA